MKNIKKDISVKKNFLYYFINQIVTFFSPLIITPYISRVLGPNGVGINSYTTATVMYFTLIANLGYLGYGQREVAIHREDIYEKSKIFWELEILHLCSTLISTLGFLILIFFSKEYRVYYVVHLVTMFSTLIDVSWIYQAEEKFKQLSIRNICIRIFVIFANFTFINNEDDLALYIFINAFSMLIANLIMWIGIKDIIICAPLHEINFLRHLKEVIIFFIPNIAASIYSILDKSVINWITHSNEQNGFYEQANKILMMVNMGVQSLATVLSPRMSNLFTNGITKEFCSRIDRSLNFMFFLAMPASLGVIGISSVFVPLFFGEGYETVINILYVLIPLVPILGLSVYLDGLYLVPSGKRKQSALAICAGACLNLVLNIILVMKAGAFGAAIATLVTESFISIIMLKLSWNVLFWHKLFKSFIKYFACSLLMLGVIKLVEYFVPIIGIYLLVIEIMCGCLIYVGLMIFIKDQFVFEIIRKVRNKIR